MSAEYYYRRQLGAKDLLPAVGVGVAAGLAGFYLVQLLIQRTPLVPQGDLRHVIGPDGVFSPHLKDRLDRCQLRRFARLRLLHRAAPGRAG